jgi:hypothetical protein
MSLILVFFEAIFVFKAYKNKIFTKEVAFDSYYIELISTEIKSFLTRDTE